MIEHRQQLRNNVISAFSIAGLVFSSSGCTSNSNDVIQSIQQSPLDEYLSAIWLTDLDPAQQQERWISNFIREQEFVAECMHDEGFDFDVDAIRSSIETNFADEADTRRPDDADWVSQFGYGIALTPPANSFSWSIPPPEGLTSSETDAFWLALNGPPAPVGVEIPWEEMGCRGWAMLQMEALDVIGLQTAEEFAPLFAAIDQMRDNLRTETTAADIDWSACMSDAGFPGFTDQFQPNEQLLNESFEIQDNWDWTTQGQWFGSLSWREFRDRELELALADLECRTATNFAARENARQIEVETQFVEDNRAALDALRTAAEQLSGG